MPPKGIMGPPNGIIGFIEGIGGMNGPNGGTRCAAVGAGIMIFAGKCGPRRGDGIGSIPGSIPGIIIMGLNTGSPLGPADSKGFGAKFNKSRGFIPPGGMGPYSAAPVW